MTASSKVIRAVPVAGPTVNSTSDSIQRKKRPELVFGFVAPIGAEIGPTIAAFRSYFQQRNYRVVEIKVTDDFLVFEKYITPHTPLIRRGAEKQRYETFIAYGNQLREKFGDSLFAATAIRRIIRERLRLEKRNLQEGFPSENFSRTVYLLHQFKRKEEIDLLRQVYGRIFFQVSIYSRRGVRVDYLSRNFAHTDHMAVAQNYRDAAEGLIKRDENEVEVSHGQRVGDIFHDADFIVSVDASDPVEGQVNRFCELLFGSNSISPTHSEYGMFLAKAAALRALDLSRQVGAAIFTKAGEVVSLGSNEVPRAGGGTYWAEDEPRDDRDYKRREDSNFHRKREILGELLGIVAPGANLDDTMADRRIRRSQFMDALEYGRMIHAEMSAISDAARLGRAIKDGTLYCTTFPCHMCAKHIVASGLSKVIFLEPYPKSLAADLHSDSIMVEGGDRGHYQQFNSVEFVHFYGVSPRRYREIFERTKRKDEAGNFVPYAQLDPVPMIDVKFPFYAQLEEYLTKDVYEALEGSVPPAPAKTKKRKSHRFKR
ncbi:MAG: dCMP deaminase [Xanthobacteraceae bacterium]|nr:dCMP deaminase [Xanthobacteraceae bacterium]